MQLPEAFRSLSRPSSAPDAKAFPLRSFQLNLPPAFQRGATVVHSCSQNHAGFTEDFNLAKLKCYPFPLCFIGLPQDFRPAAPLCCLAYHFPLFSFQGAEEDTRECAL